MRRPRNSGSLYRPACRDRHGVLRQGRFWRMAWKGGRSQSTGTEDYKLAEAILAKAMKQAVVKRAPSMPLAVADAIAGCRTGKFTGADLRALRQPVVYVWFRGEEALYVGKGEGGMARPLSQHHHQLQGLLDTDVLQVIFCDSREDAIALERRLIASMRPRLNGIAA